MAALSLSTQFIASETAEQRGMKPEAIIIFFVTVRDASVKVETAKLPGIHPVRRTLHGITLSSNNSANEAVNRFMNVEDVWSFLLYQRNLSGMD